MAWWESFGGEAGVARCCSHHQLDGSPARCGRPTGRNLKAEIAAGLGSAGDSPHGIGRFDVPYFGLHFLSLVCFLRALHPLN
jgi:hypothetical protein